MILRAKDFAVLCFCSFFSEVLVLHLQPCRSGQELTTTSPSGRKTSTAAAGCYFLEVANNRSPSGIECQSRIGSLELSH